MAQTLIIVESAAKSKTIQNYLGGGYVVRACFGHVRDLPTDRMGVDVDRDFAAEYVVPEARARVVKELKAEDRAASAVLLARVSGPRTLASLRSRPSQPVVSGET